MKGGGKLSSMTLWLFPCDLIRPIHLFHIHSFIHPFIARSCKPASEVRRTRWHSTTISTTPSISAALLTRPSTADGPWPNAPSARLLTCPSTRAPFAGFVTWPKLAKTCSDCASVTRKRAKMRRRCCVRAGDDD